MKKILVVDDSEIMRRNIKAIITSANKYIIVGEAKNGSEAFDMYEKYLPDIVTMDVTMPVMDGVESSKKILSKHPDAKIIIVSALDQKSTVFTALEFGVKQYIMKPVTPKSLLKAISDIAESDDKADNKNNIGILDFDISEADEVSEAKKAFVIEKDSNGHIIFNVKAVLGVKEIAKLKEEALKITIASGKKNKFIFNFENINITEDSVIEIIFEIFKKMAESGINFIMVSTNVSFLQTLVIKEYEMNTKVVFKSNILDALKS